MALCCCYRKKKKERPVFDQDIIIEPANLDSEQASQPKELTHQQLIHQYKQVTSYHGDHADFAHQSQPAKVMNGYIGDINMNNLLTINPDDSEDASEHLIKRYQIIAESLNKGCNVDLPLFYPVPGSLPPGHNPGNRLSEEIPTAGETVAMGPESLHQLLEQAYGELLRLQSLDEVHLQDHRVKPLHPIEEEESEEGGRADNDQDDIKVNDRQDAGGEMVIFEANVGREFSIPIARKQNSNRNSIGESVHDAVVDDIGISLEDCAEWMDVKEWERNY